MSPGQAFHLHAGYIRPRGPIMKIVASAVTLGTGRPGGREGPIAQIGSGFHRALGLSDHEQRIMIIARAARGIGAIFRAPLRGALVIFGLLRTGWCITAVIALAASAAVLLSAMSGVYVFDRNNDGIDDRGLDLDFAATDAPHLLPIPLIVGCLRRSCPCIRLMRHSCSNPRSPPLTF